MLRRIERSLRGEYSCTSLPVSVRAASTRSKPFAASASAVARPMPRLEPVTSATLRLIAGSRRGSRLTPGAVERILPPLVAREGDGEGKRARRQARADVGGGRLRPPLRAVARPLARLLALRALGRRGLQPAAAPRHARAAQRPGAAGGAALVRRGPWPRRDRRLARRAARRPPLGAQPAHAPRRPHPRGPPTASRPGEPRAGRGTRRPLEGDRPARTRLRGLSGAREGAPRAPRVRARARRRRGARALVSARSRPRARRRAPGSARGSARAPAPSGPS